MAHCAVKYHEDLSWIVRREREGGEGKRFISVITYTDTHIYIMFVGASWKKRQVRKQKMQGQEKSSGTLIQIPTPFVIFLLTIKRTKIPLSLSYIFRHYSITTIIIMTIILRGNEQKERENSSTISKRGI